MFVFASTLIQFLIVASCILLLFKARKKIGLAPLYLLLGSLQYFQINSENQAIYKIFGEFPVYLVSLVLFSALLFAVLLIYIREGVISAQTLITGIFIYSLFLTGLFEITTIQGFFIKNQNNLPELNLLLLSKINYKVFIVGTLLLFLDFILLATIYQFLISKIHKKYYFLILFLALWSVLIFDALAFNTILYWGKPSYTSSLIGHLIGKTIAALLYSFVLYLYLMYIDKVFLSTGFIAEQSRDVFSILNYKKKYFDLKVEKEISEKKITAQYERTLTAISDGISSFDSNWCYTYINKQGAELIGKTPEDLIGKHLWTEIPELVELPFYDAFQLAVKTQQIQVIQEFYPPLGRWFENRIYPTPTGSTIYYTEITEKKKIEIALLKSEAFNKGILSSLRSHIAVIDKTGEIIAVNKAWNDFSLNNGEQNLSRTAVGSNYFQVCNHAIANGDLVSKKVLAGLKSVLNKEINHFEIEYPCHGNNKKRWFTMYIEPFGTESDKLVISLNNITQLKNAEELLESSNVKLIEAQRIAKLGNWELNPLTKEVFFSDEIYQIFEIDNSTTLDLYTTYRSKCMPEDIDSFNELVSNALKNKKGYTIGYYIKVNEDTFKYIQEIGEIVKDKNGENLKLKGTIQDITKDKIISDQLVANNIELEKANTELDRFVYSASHDLRSPLTSLRGLIQIMEMELDSLEKFDKEPIRMMTKTINKMDSFIADILDYSLNTRKELEKEKINIDSLITSSWEDLQYMDLDYQPKLNLNINQTADFISDPKRVAIIINNILSNAFKYHDKNKTEHFIKIAVAVDDKKANFIIEDNGIGISEEQIHKIFNMFHRATTLSTGSGMGLYIVKETLAKLKGKIQVESTLDQGTIFRIRIPNLL